MNAITQSEIFALISEINAFADNSETLINNSRSAYEKNKQVLLNRHNSSLSQLEKTYKSNCDAISRKSKKTIQEAQQMLTDIDTLDARLSQVDKYYRKTKEKKEAELSGKTSDQYQNVNDYFSILEKIKEDYAAISKKYSEDILPALINGLNYFFSSKRKKDYEALIILRNTLKSFEQEIEDVLPSLTTEELAQQKKSYFANRATLLDNNNRELANLEENYRTCLDNIADKICASLDEILPDVLVDFLHGQITEHSKLRDKVNTNHQIEDGILYVNKEAVEAVALEDEHIKSVSFDIARPGESVRITPVKDVIEPRVKVEGRGGVFPGVINKVDTVGEGKTYALKGMAVVTAGKIVGFQEGIIDMTGVGAQYTPFSKTLNLVMVCEPVDNIKQHDYEKAVRFAGFRVAVYLGELARNLTPDETKVYETYGVMEGKEKFPDLPRVAYVQMLQSQGLLHDTYVYGVDAKKTLSTLMTPTEIMDGAIVSGNCVSACDKNPTYVHENNPVIHDLFEEHGKTINFVCHILTNENVYLADKMRSSDWTAKLCRFLDLDAVIVSQEGFGNPDTDLIMNTKKIEAEGVKTVIITDEYAGRDGKSQSLADSDPAADAVVTGGNANELIHLPKLDKVIGTLDYVNVIAGASDKTLQEDGSLEVEIQVMTGATNETGFNVLSAR